MGSGKSTIARALSRELDCPYVDLDRAVETDHNLSIPEIFAAHGEATFRRWETEALRHHSVAEHIIIATGGGTPCVGDNMDYMLGSGLTIYLKHDAAQLAVRLANSHTVRPLLTGKTTEQIAQFVAEKLSEREPVYGRSSMIVANPTRDIKRIVELIHLHQQYTSTNQQTTV